MKTCCESVINYKATQSHMLSLEHRFFFSIRVNLINFRNGYIPVAAASSRD